MFVFGLGENARDSYEKLNEKIEFASRIVHFCLAKVTIVGVVLPALLVTAASYYIYDLGSDSFYLPFPVM